MAGEHGGAVQEPELKRAVIFIDGQNLYHHARAAFNVTHPYDVMLLAQEICKANGWFLKSVRFYNRCIDKRDYR